MQITSNKNPEIKYLKSLEIKKYREKEKVFVIEGVRIIEDALADNADFVKVYYGPMLQTSQRGMELLKILQSNEVESVALDDKLFNEVACTETPQGLIAVVKQPVYHLADLFKQKSLYPHIMMLNSVQDPGNLGTILRTVAGAGWAGAILTKGTVDLYNPKSLRATMGAIHKLPLFREENGLDEIWESLQSNGYQIIATALEGSKMHFEVDFGRPTVVVVGNEGKGVEREILEKADQLVKIPMAPNAESLNVAIAAGVFIFEGVRQNLLVGI